MKLLYTMDVTHIHIKYSLQTNIVQVSRKEIQWIRLVNLILRSFESCMTSLLTHRSKV